ncbi:hypothetical protein [Chromohalobacter canadensis]|nr:hypothetical protein [Chromohalobacter canadensis]
MQGIETAWDLRQIGPKAIRRRFSVTLEQKPYASFRASSTTPIGHVNAS